MNDDPPNTPQGDEALEARIVSWVLGEASAFEAAELERLCVERPELLVFKRRMLSLHGLLAEAETTQSDGSWKLPAEKRKVLDEIFGEKPLAKPEVEKEKRIRHSGRRALLAIAACLVLTIVVAGLLSPAVMRQRKKADLTELRHRKIMMELSALESDQASETENADDLDLGILADGMEVIPSGPAQQSSTPAPSSVPEILSRSAGKGISKKPNTLAKRERMIQPEEPVRGIPSAEPRGRDDRGEGWGGKSVAGRLGAESQQPATSQPTARPAAASAPRQTALAGNRPRKVDILPRRFVPVDRLRNEELKSAAVDSDQFYRSVRAEESGVDGQTQSVDKLTRSLDAAEENQDRAAYDPKRAELFAQEDGRWYMKGPVDESAGATGRKTDAYRESGLKADTIDDADKAAPSGRVVYNFKKTSGFFFKEKNLGDLVKPESQVRLLDLSEENSAAEDPYSTFSLNISDASFQVAQAALAKGEQPDPVGIKVEQFYNAVDYGDPAPSADEPVAAAIEQCAHPVIPGRNLVRISLKTAAAGRSASQPLRLTLLVDQSGSMARDDRRAAMDKALAGLSEMLRKTDLVTVIGFARTPHLLADGMTGDKAQTLADLINQAASEGGTNLEEAIQLGERMAERHKLVGAQNRIVLFTDGAANLGNADPGRLAEKVKELRQKGIAFDIAGIAADRLNDELLGELARNGNGRYYIVGKRADGNFAKQLAGAFRPAAENVKVQVRFNPERVGRYKLIGFEKDRLKTEDFRNDKVDAAELAAEEAGVAIYQVEPLPEGHGELGEVSVRFRDTAANQMVERAWTIPHDAAAPALDRATPSMQLAVLSMLSGEKLKGGPLADAIDFKQLAGPCSGVKKFYGDTGRVGEVLRMVDALK